MNYLSLFSGCGGFDLGFEEAGFKSIGAIDNDSNVLNVHKKNLKGKTYAFDLSGGTLPSELEKKKIDVLISGSPCQGFSTVGQRKLQDPRNELLLVGGEIARRYSPKVVVFENVMGSVSGSHKVFWDILMDNLASLNYNFKFLKCFGSDIGMAQIRKRIFLIAWIGNKDLDFEVDLVKTKTLRDVLSDIDDVPNQNEYFKIKDVKTIKIIRRIDSGQKLCNVRGGENSIHTWEIPEIFGKVSDREKYVLVLIKSLRRRIRKRAFGDADPLSLLEINNHSEIEVDEVVRSLLKKGYLKETDKKFDLVHTYNGLYKRLEWDKCSMTVDTRFGNPRYFLHPEEHRGFTVREAARIQGFKDDFLFFGTIEQKFKMIGNAVPPPMSKVIAEIIRDKILNEQ